MSLDFARKYRPRTLDDVVGQDEVVSRLRQKFDSNSLRHAIMLIGPTGTGKTTLARIIGSHLMGRQVADRDDPDFEEINCGSCDPMDKVKDVQMKMGMSPLTCDVRCYYFDEVQTFSRSKASQEGMLKMIEDVPDHVYFLFATTDPQRIVKTIRGRCTKFHLKAVEHEALEHLINRVLKAEKVEGHPEKVIAKIIKKAEGSAREALVMLDLTVGLDSVKEMLAAIEDKEEEKTAYDLAGALIWKKKKWPDIAAIISALPESTDWERLRHMVNVHAGKAVLAGKEHAARAQCVLEVFKESWIYNNKVFALIYCCREVFNVGQKENR